MAQLDKTDLELLIILQEKPTANDLTLARLVNLSSPTVKRRIDRLYRIGAIERIQGLLNYPALGLKFVSVFITNPFQNINELKEILRSHKYIYYLVRCIGTSNGIHATFRMPNTSIKYTENLLQKLKNEGLMENFILYLHKNEEIRSRPRFIVYNSAANSWDFNFVKWIEIPPEQLQRGIERSELNSEIYLSDLDNTDIEILSILSLNSRIKNVDILNQISSNLTAQRLSDRLRYLKKHFLVNYRVYLNWKAIFAFMGILFDCKANEKQKIFFKTLLQVNPPPFESIYRETEGGFLLYLVCPLDHVYPAMDSLFKICKSVSIYILKYESAIRASLNSETFDSEKKQWKDYKPY